MRQAIGSTWIMQLVIIFMLIFVAFLALTINYTKAFKIKNELVTMIEKYEGLSVGKNGSVALINNYLKYNNYTIKSTCEEGEWGAKSLDSEVLEYSESKEKYYYCVKKTSTATNGLQDIVNGRRMTIDEALQDYRERAEDYIYRLHIYKKDLWLQNVSNIIIYFGNIIFIYLVYKKCTNYDVEYK